MLAGRRAAVSQLLGVCAGAAACYWVYRLIAGAGRRRRDSGSGGGGGGGGKPGSLIDRVSGISPRAAARPDNVPQSAGDLKPHHIKKLLEIVATSSDTSLRELALVSLCNSAAFSVNQDLIRNLDGIRVIGEALSDLNSEVKVKALNTLNNLSMNVQNQKLIKDFLHGVCEMITSAALNSELQLAGLRLLINMSVTNSHHNHFIDYISFFLTLLAEGNRYTQIHASKVLVNLSANPSMAAPLLHSKGSSLLNALFDSCVHTDILSRVLRFAANVSENLESAHNCNGHYDENSLHTLLFGDSALLKMNLSSLSEHPEVEVKEQAARLIQSSK
ncbi:armadillo repeat-containing 10 [Pelobates cultripes]|uniref:Armadillo repeat-containing 10 n=1 Tax=Pelobates cultripes TaxID=61616 RepID=A0AAD1RPK3_PELCU|nr:armadillo repeat-containing 10 [Pelobates cultripes]